MDSGEVQEFAYCAGVACENDGVHGGCQGRQDRILADGSPAEILHDRDTHAGGSEAVEYLLLDGAGDEFPMDAVTGQNQLGFTHGYSPSS
jgi:hypothetical protein